METEGDKRCAAQATINLRAHASRRLSGHDCARKFTLPALISYYEKSTSIDFRQSAGGGV